VQLPLDGLGVVGVRDSAPAGSILGKTIQGVSFGSITGAPGTVSGSQASNLDAARLLAPATKIVQAQGAFLVPFDAAQAVGFFLATSPTGGFDSRDVVFTDQGTDGLEVHALIGVGASGAVSNVQTIALQGSGGAIATALPIVSAVTSTGPMGDFVESAPQGITANVTIPSGFGSIIATLGPISGTIQTTSGDLGRVTTSPTIGALPTSVSAATGISGRVIVRGNLISQVVSGGGISGLIAVQGNMGTTATVGSGPAAQVVRLGGLRSDGPISGQVVTLGSILGDFVANGGLKGGRIAAQNGILGNMIINGGLDSSAALVSDGVIGSATYGTTLVVTGDNKGIIAAEGLITFGKNGVPKGSVFNKAGGTPSGNAIDAIFMSGGVRIVSFDLTPLDLYELGQILNDLAALKVDSKGNLT
jgi:hypothetical protein